MLGTFNGGGSQTGHSITTNNSYELQNYTSTIRGSHSIKFGAHVSVVDEETEKQATYQIVGVHEADIKSARLSISSPLAKSLIGKKVGDSVSVPAPGGDRTYEILSIKFI